MKVHDIMHLSGEEAKLVHAVIHAIVGLAERNTPEELGLTHRDIRLLKQIKFKLRNFDSTP
jgi:hypothetical protein